MGREAADNAYSRPLNIAGEEIEVRPLPRFGPEPDTARELIERPSDVAEWGEKEDRGSADYQEPFKVAGETVDLSSLPKFGSQKPRSSADAEDPDGR